MTPKKLIAASTEPILLSILSRGESYGYEIIQRVRRASEGALEWTDGMLYPVLHRLEKSGAVRARWGQSDQGRKRRYYAITAKGKRTLDAEREAWNTINETVQSFWGASHA